MKKIFFFIIPLICFASCEKDYDVTITGVDFHANVVYDDYSVEAEFLDSSLIFGADFSLDPDHVTSFYKRVDEVTIINPVDEDKFVLTSSLDLFLSGDTIKKGENLANFFEYKMLKNDFRLSYNFRSTESFLNETDYYKFYFTAVLSDDTEFLDSCLVKVNF